MSSTMKCVTCNSDFITLNHIPMVLPCQHTVCSNCISDQYQKQKMIQCPFNFCKKVHKQNPLSYSKNQEIIQKLLQKENQQEQFENAIQVLKVQRENIVELRKDITHQQNHIIKHVLDLLQKILFAKSNEVIIECDQLLDDIDYKIDGLQSIIDDLLNQNQYLNLESTEEIIDIESLQLWESKAVQQIKNLKKQDPLFNHLEKMLENIADFQLQIQEVSANLQSQEQKDIGKLRQEQQKEEQKIELQTKNKSSLIYRFKFGSKDLHTFDIETNQHQVIKIQQVIPSFSRNVGYQDYIYLVGGKAYNEQLKSTWQVDLQGNCTQLSDLNQARDSFGIAVSKGSMFVAGGINSKQKAIKTVECLKLMGKDQWRMCASLPFEICNQTLVSDEREENIYSFGGQNIQSQTLKCILKFNVLKDEWLQTDFQLPQALQVPAAILQPLLVFGGDNFQTKQESNKIYKRVGSEWQQGTLPEACFCNNEVKINGNYAYAWMYSINLADYFLVMKVNLETLESELVKKVKY